MKCLHTRGNYKVKNVLSLKNIGCPTRYQTRHFFNNFTTNEDIATKFEADYRHTLQTHSFSFLTQRTYSYNIFIGGRIIKEMLGSVASGTHCINRKPEFCVIYRLELSSIKITAVTLYRKITISIY